MDKNMNKYFTKDERQKYEKMFNITNHQGNEN